MSDNGFLDNYGNMSDEKAAAPKSYTFEQKSGFKKPKRGEPRPPDQGGGKKRMITWLVAGGVVLAVVVVALILIFSSGGGVTVIDFTGRPLSDAQLWANENSVMLSKTEDYHDEVEQGSIISQDIEAGDKVKKGSFLTLTVSLGPDLSVMVPLPDLKSMTSDEIEAWADQNLMTKVRIATEYSANVPAGRVIDYEVSDTTVVDEVRRDTPIHVTVSKGPEEEAATITVPDFGAISLAECYAFAGENGITLTVEEEYDDYVPAGTMISQSVKPDELVSKGSEIILVFSKGPKIIVPDFAGYTQDEASAVAAQLGITVSVTEKYSGSSAGRLISQSIGADSIYESGALLELKYSLGNKIVIGSYVGQTRDAIESWAKELNEQGARITIKATEAKSSQPRGTIIYQDVANKTKSYKVTIKITVSEGKVVYVPDFVGPGDNNYNNAITREKAIAMCEEVGLIPVFEEKAMEGDLSNVLPGEIWKQSIKAGAETSEGKTITLYYNKTERKSVPYFTTKQMTQKKAREFLTRLDITFEQGESYDPEGNNVVIGQSLAEGSTVAMGSAITLILGVPS